jgi:hypothetical protein
MVWRLGNYPTMEIIETLMLVRANVTQNQTFTAYLNIVMKFPALSFIIYLFVFVQLPELLLKIY